MTNTGSMPGLGMVLNRANSSDQLQGRCRLQLPALLLAGGEKCPGLADIPMRYLQRKLWGTPH